MVKINAIYEGDLRCRVTHEQSGTVVITDAPKDNMGKGESFSPTDLVVSALASCMLTIMGIAANKHNIDLKGTKVDVIKEMVISPVRRIGALKVGIYMPKGIPIEKRSLLENAAHTCPVHKSLHPDIQIPVQFHYSD